MTVVRYLEHRQSLIGQNTLHLDVRLHSFWFGRTTDKKFNYRAFSLLAKQENDSQRKVELIFRSKLI